MSAAPGTRGEYMGITLGGGTISDSDLFIVGGYGVGWIRAGFVEVQNMLATPGNVSSAGAFDATPVKTGALKVLRAGMGMHFSMLGCPKQVNPNAGTGGNWKYHADDSLWPGGIALMRSYATAIAHALMDAQRAVPGSKVKIEVNQEANIRSAFNPGAQSAAVLGKETAELILAIRAAEPTLEIMFPSLANFGNITSAADAGWTSPDYLRGMVDPAKGGDGRLLGIGADARPDWLGHHPYPGTSLPTAEDGWAMGQLDAYTFTARAIGMTNRAGAQIVTCITEWGVKRVPVLNADGTVKDYFDDTIASTRTASMMDEFDKRRAAGVLGGVEERYTAVGDPYGLSRSTGVRYPSGDVFVRYAAKVVTVGPPPPPPPPRPVASFQPSVLSGVAPLVVQFTDRSTDAASHHYDFGDSVTSNQASPTHSFSLPGTYPVTLTVTNASGTATSTRTITVASPIPTPKPTPPGAQRVQFLAYDYPTKQFTGEVNLSSVQWSDGISAEGSFDATGLAKADVAKLRPGRTGLYVVRGADVVWGGWCWTRSFAQKRATGKGVWSYYREGRAPIRATLTYTSQDAFAIVAALIAWHQAEGPRSDPLSLTIRRNPTNSGIIRTVTYALADLKPIGEAIEELAASGPFDFVISTEWDTSVSPHRPKHFLDLWYPRVGRRTPIVWLQGSQIEVLEVTEDASRLASVVSALGASHAMQNAVLSTANVRLERQVTFQDVTDASLLAAHAAQELARTSVPQQTVKVRLLAPELHPLGSWIPGDEVYIGAHDELYDLDGYFRIQAYTANADADGIISVEVDLADSALGFGQPIHGPSKRLTSEAQDLTRRLERLER